MPRAKNQISKHEARIAEGLRKREIVKQGYCTDCETAKQGINKDGSASIRCDDCKAKRVPKRKEPETSIRRVLSNQPVRKYDADGDALGFLDNAEYKAYCDRLRKIIERSKYPMTMRETKAAMGERVNERWHADAMDSLKWCIEEFQSGAMSRYRPAIRRAVEPRAWDKTISISPNGTPRPDDAAYEDRRITA